MKNLVRWLALVAVLLSLTGCAVTFDSLSAPASTKSVDAGESSGAYAPPVPAFTYAMPETGDSNFTNLIASGYVEAVGGFVATKATALAITDGYELTAAASYQPLTSAGTVTMTLAAGDAGHLLILVNTSATTINVADSGTAVLTAAAALGQHDSLTLISNGTSWIEVARANN